MKRLPYLYCKDESSFVNKCPDVKVNVNANVFSAYIQRLLSKRKKHADRGRDIAITHRSAVWVSPPADELQFKKLDIKMPPKPSKCAKPHPNKRRQFRKRELSMRFFVLFVFRRVRVRGLARFCFAARLCFPRERRQSKADRAKLYLYADSGIIYRSIYAGGQKEDKRKYK